MIPPSVLDTAFGLHCVAGNKALYRKLLGKFVDQQGSAAIEIEKALQANDTELAHRLAHTLKGVAASLGICDVQQAATDIDAAFKACQDVTPLLPILAACMNEAITAIATQLEH